MLADWRLRSLGELTNNFDNIRIPVRETDRRPGPYPYYGASGVVDHVDEYLFDGEYLLVAEDGENLRTRNTPVAFLARGRFWVNNHAHIIQGNGNADTRFLRFALKAADISGYLTGSTMPKLTQGNMNRIPVLAPPLRQQRAIARVIGSLDDKIELNRRMNETLEVMARALFRSWFVEFDPVRAKAEGRDPGLPPPIADLFPDRLLDSELGEVPGGWPVVSLTEMVEVKPARTLRRGEIAPYLDMANMPTRGHTPETVIERPLGSGARFVNGDTLLARITPCLENGKTAFVDFLADGQVGWGSTEYIVLRPRPQLPPEFAYCLARDDRFREFAIQSMTGTSGRQRIPPEALTHYSLAEPPGPIADQFGALVRSALARAAAGMRESMTLAALRDLLLPKLVSGEIRVKDAEEPVEAILAQA
jgi:type I restriction enzyme S subunit